MCAYDLSRKRRRSALPSPLLLIVVGVALVGAVLAWTQDDGSRMGRFGVFLFVLGGWVVSVCFHEFAHAYAAFRAGDRSVEAAGYLKLNPFKYAHWFLSLVLPLLFIIQGGIGLPGGAVYLHRHMFRSRAMQSVASLAGPLVNLVLAGVLLVVARGHAQHNQFWSAVAFLGFLQVTATVLNLLPIPGLDGWGVIEPYLRPETREFGDKIKPWGMIGVIVLLQINSINDAFFRLVLAVYDLFGTDRFAAALGRTFFQFWTKYG